MKAWVLRTFFGSVAGIATAFSALAASPSAGELIAAQGKSGGIACTACHGATGQGQSGAGFPRLAGMSAEYLSRQLAAFAAGTRVNPVMGPVAKLLDGTDRQAVAGYYAGLRSEAEAPAGETKMASPNGELLAKRGDWNDGLPACAQCHGPDGLGVGSNFPQLSGQPSAYLANQLRAWKQGTRKDDPMGLMQGIAKKLSETQIAAVADFYASQPLIPAASTKAKP